MTFSPDFFTKWELVTLRVDPSASGMKYLETCYFLTNYMQQFVCSITRHANMFVSVTPRNASISIFCLYQHQRLVGCNKKCVQDCFQGCVWYYNLHIFRELTSHCVLHYTLTSKYSGKDTDVYIIIIKHQPETFKYVYYYTIRYV